MLARDAWEERFATGSLFVAPPAPPCAPRLRAWRTLAGAAGVLPDAECSTLALTGRPLFPGLAGLRDWLRALLRTQVRHERPCAAMLFTSWNVNSLKIM